MPFPLPTLSTATLVALLAVSVVMDVWSRRIPNVLVLAGLASAFLLHSLAWGASAAPLAGPHAWSSLAGAAVGLLALLPLYLPRACGAGDMKLMAVVGAFVGAPMVLAAALYTVLAGGVLSLLWLCRPGVAARAWRNIQALATGGASARAEPLAHTAARLPYALAITAGTLIALR